MSMMLHTDTESLSRRLTDGLSGELEAAIKRELMKQTDSIISNMAREMAQNLRGHIEMWRDFTGDRLQVALVIDGVKELVTSRSP